MIAMWKFRLLKHISVSNVGAGVDPFSGEPIIHEKVTDVYGLIVPAGAEEMKAGFQTGSFVGFFKENEFASNPVPNQDKILDGTTYYKIVGFRIWEEKNLCVLELQK